MGLSLRKIKDFASRAYDQVNPFDNNRTWQQRTPTQSKSNFQQLGQIGGQAVRQSVRANARVANTVIAQVPQIESTIRMMMASRTNNPIAFRNAQAKADWANNQFNRGYGGIMNVGTLYSSDEAKRGDFKTGITRIGGGTVDAMLEAATLGYGAPVGKSVLTKGVVNGIRNESRNLAKTAGLNFAQGTTSAKVDGASWGDALQAGALNATAGTVADVGLGVAGAAFNSGRGMVVRWIKNKIPEVHAYYDPNYSTKRKTVNAAKKIVDGEVAPPKVEVPQTGLTPVKQKLMQLEADGKGNTKIAQRMRQTVAKSDPLESLKQEARKYKSAEEFIDTDKTISVPIRDFPKTDTTSWNEALNNVSKGELSKTAGPVEVVLTPNGYKLVEGNHRAVQALQSGKDSIEAKIISKEGLEKIAQRDGPHIKMNMQDSLTRQQLTNLYNQATQSQPPKSTPPVKAKPQVEAKATTQKPKAEAKPKVVVAEPKKPVVKAKDTVKSQRAKDVQRVHIIKKQKNITAKKYRDIAYKTTGKTSSKDMTDKQLGAFKKALEDHGKKPVVYVVSGKAKKDPVVKELLRYKSKAQNMSSQRGSQAANEIHVKAKELGIDDTMDLVHRYQSGQMTTPQEKELAKTIQKLTDEDFADLQKLDASATKEKNHLRQYYEDDPTYEVGTRKTSNKTGAEQQKTFKTYEEAITEGKKTPKYTSVEEIVGSQIRDTKRALVNKDMMEYGLEKGIFSYEGGGKTALEGMSHNGRPVYAEKKVADLLNDVTQRRESDVAKGWHIAAQTAELGQDVMLQGGIQKANFFVSGQVVKKLTTNLGKTLTHPIRATKSSYRALATLVRTKEGMARRFADPDTVKFTNELAEHGLYLSPQTKLTQQGKGGAKRAWDTLGNNPTFARYMPDSMLDMAEETYEQLTKGRHKMSHKEAIKTTAETVKTYNGQVDAILKGRTKENTDMRGTVFFAPKYRESIFGTLINVVKSVSPHTWNDPKYTPSRELFAGMVITLAAYEATQRKLTGHGMLDNRDGQELSLEIPYGEKDEKGNQPVVNIPWMPGFTFVPVAIGKGAAAIGEQDVKGFLKQAGKFGSAAIQTAAELISNKDYKGDPIYMDEENAAINDVEEDSAGTKALKAGTHVVTKHTPAWVRGVSQYIAEGNAVKSAATFMEAPVRFGKKLPKATEMHFKDEEDIKKGLNKNERAIWDSLFGSTKNVNGDYLHDQKSVYHGHARAAIMLSSLTEAPGVMKGAMEKARRAKERGEKVDPFYELDEKKQYTALVMDTLDSANPEKKKLRKDNEGWYKDYSAKRSAFFDSLPKGDPNKPKGPISYPEPTAEVERKKEAYFKLTDSKMKRKFLEDNTDLTDQMALEEQYTRGVRALKGLPQYDKYPEAPADIQKIMDEYSALPKSKSAGNTDPNTNKARSSWIKAHPKEWAKMTEQFSKQALFSLQQDMQMSAFEGEDPTEKGIKAIKSLAQSSGGSYGYGGGGGKKKGSKGVGDGSKYRVSMTSRAMSAPKVSIKSAGSYKSMTANKGGGGKPKVSMKKSLV